MKTKYFFLALSCFFFLSIVGYAQRPIPSPEEKRQHRIDQIKRDLLKKWDGQRADARAISAYTPYGGVRLELGISKEQYEQIREAPVRGRKEWEASPEYEKLSIETAAIYERVGFERPRTGGFIPSMANLDAEDYKQLENISTRMNELQNIAIDKAYEGILTPEQVQKLHEVELVNVGWLSILSPSMFEGLRLTDAQREQMQTLAKDFEPELEKYCENYAELRVTHDEVVFRVLEEQEGATTAEKLRATDKILVEDPEYIRIIEAIPSFYPFLTSRGESH